MRPRPLPSSSSLVGGSNNSVEISSDKCSMGTISWMFLQFGLIDILGYGLAIPLLGSVMAGDTVNRLGLGLGTEIVLTVAFTMIGMLLSIKIGPEQSYWSCLFRGDHEHCQTLLRIRDMINTATTLICVYGLASTVQEMIADKAMKPRYLSEGVPYVAWKYFFRCLYFVDEDKALKSFGLKLPHKRSMMNPDFFGENNCYEHGAKLMLFFAMLSASVGKMLYYNALFTYHRALNIFISLHPTFENNGKSGSNMRYSRASSTV